MAYISTTTHLPATCLMDENNFKNWFGRLTSKQLLFTNIYNYCTVLATPASPPKAQQYLGEKQNCSSKSKMHIYKSVLHNHDQCHSYPS